MVGMRTVVMTATCRLNQSFYDILRHLHFPDRRWNTASERDRYDNNNGDLVADSEHTPEGVRRCDRVSDILSIIDFPNVAAT